MSLLRNLANQEEPWTHLRRCQPAARLDKRSPYLQAAGEVDRLNGLLGVLNCKIADPAWRDFVDGIQRDLLALADELSRPGRLVLTDRQVARLEAQTRRLEKGFPPVGRSDPPGGSEACALCHYAWATCGAVERTLLWLEDIDPAPQSVRLPYVDRLSSFLSALARSLGSREAASGRG